MFGALIDLAAGVLAVIGLVGAGVRLSPYEAAILLLAFVALHVLLRGRLLRLLLMAAGLLGLVYAHGVQVLSPFLSLVGMLFGFWVLFGGPARRNTGSEGRK